MPFFWNSDEILEDPSVQRAVDRVLDKANGVSDEVARLTRQVDRLTLASQAMWEIIRATGAVTDEHLLAKMEEIDLRDGKLDGTIGPSPVPCSQCQRPTNSRRGSCTYCGAAIQKEHVFEG